MKLKQMRYLLEASTRNFNFSEVARAIHTSQPVISRQIQLLEEELGFDVLQRHRKRIIGLTKEGETVLAIARRILKESNDLKRFAVDHSSRRRGRLTVATTHFHARYTLIDPILKYRKLHPQVLLQLKQTDPTDVERLVNSEAVDLGITAQSPTMHSEVASVHWQTVPRIAIVPQHHPLLNFDRLTLRHLSAYPLILYDEKYSGGWSVMQTFREKKQTPNVVMTAMDADVIKTYVSAGLGVSIVQAAVYNPRQDLGLRAIDASHLFAPLQIVLMLKPRAYLHQDLIDFVSTVMPELDLPALASAVSDN